jgi:hypothetical protein
LRLRVVVANIGELKELGLKKEKKEGVEKKRQLEPGNSERHGRYGVGSVMSEYNTHHLFSPQTTLPLLR